MATSIHNAGDHWLFLQLQNRPKRSADILLILQVWIIDSQDFEYYLQQIISMSKRSNADTRTHAHVSVRDRKAEFVQFASNGLSEPVIVRLFGV